MKKIFILMFLITYGISLTSQKQSVKAKELEGISVGSKVDMFEAMDANGDMFSLQNALKKGPVVLVFYRGFWCPHCNKHLEILQDSLQLIEDIGASVVAVSPEKPEYLQKMVEKTEVEFTLLYDEAYEIENSFALTFKPSGMELFAYNTFMRARLKDSHSDDSQLLPIPATFLIDQEGIIVWRHFDPDYKERSNVKDIIHALQRMKF